MIIFESLLTTFKERIFFEAAGAVVEISSSQKHNHYNQVELFQIWETQWS